jgi:hypothetical protein
MEQLNELLDLIVNIVNITILLQGTSAQSSDGEKKPMMLTLIHI